MKTKNEIRKQMQEVKNEIALLTNKRESENYLQMYSDASILMHKYILDDLMKNKRKLLLELLEAQE